jgi:hypothetical protein
VTNEVHAGKSHAKKGERPVVRESGRKFTPEWRKVKVRHRVQTGNILINKRCEKPGVW